MTTFHDFNLNKQLLHAIADLGYTTPTAIQQQAYSTILSGANVVGIAQTGTGKTMAYLLPILQQLTYSEQVNPRVLIVVPTRELVLQIVEMIEQLTKYKSVRVIGVFGGTNINTQKLALLKGSDIVVATPGRIYDIALSGAIQLKAIKTLVLDEVDVILDLGFRFQLENIFNMLPERRQNIMLSATMTDDVELFIDELFVNATKISIALSGTRLENIDQTCYSVKNFYTKVNLLTDLLMDKKTFHKVIVFIAHKRSADRLYDALQEDFSNQLSIIHSNKSQNFRINAIDQFEKGKTRVLIATDVIARGIDLTKISHVINFDTPHFPENYIHRIGRTGRAEAKGSSILFYTEKEEEAKLRIETLMNYEIPKLDFPEDVEISLRLAPEEEPVVKEIFDKTFKRVEQPKGFHEKSEKNKKVNLGGSYKRRIAEKYSKPKTRGDKNYNKNKRK